MDFMLNLPMPVQKEVHQLGPYAYKTRKIKKFGFNTDKSDEKGHLRMLDHELRTPGEEIAFTARPKIKAQSQIFRYGRSIFCLPYQPKISVFFDLCLHWVSVVRAFNINSTILFTLLWSCIISCCWIIWQQPAEYSGVIKQLVNNLSIKFSVWDARSNYHIGCSFFCFQYRWLERGA